MKIACFLFNFCFSNIHFSTFSSNIILQCSKSCISISKFFTYITNTICFFSTKCSTNILIKNFMSTKILFRNINKSFIKFLKVIIIFFSSSFSKSKIIRTNSNCFITIFNFFISKTILNSKHKICKFIIRIKFCNHLTNSIDILIKSSKTFLT